MTLLSKIVDAHDGVCEVLRSAIFSLAALLLGWAFIPEVLAQATCPATPVAACVLSGAVNDYWQGSGNAAAAATTVTLGARRAGGAGSTIASGDLVLLIQMQDADIDTTNSNVYGSGVAGNGGSGSSALNSAGKYQFVRATGAVAAGGGALTFTPALSFALSTRNNTGSGTPGQARWQAIRVPPCATASASSVTAPDWNGLAGGVVALDVLGALTLGGGTAINVSGLGFRGGAGRQLTGAGAGANTDYRTIAPAAAAAANASKGEGIAGTPRFVNNVTTYNGAPVLTDTALEGYQNGSFARGAPGNAGGGGTDGNAAANDQNTGGGGGGNYGAGSVGGNSWNSNLAVGGRGGFGYGATLNMGVIFMGGGGGAGTTNNATQDAATYAAPPGVGCSLAALCSSGARGGGIVIVRAGSISGGGVIDARGADGYNVANDAGGGGGAGGSVVLQTYSGGSATINVAGGNGGNAWRSQALGTPPDNRHGPGGGGGGGFIAFSPSTGLTISATTAGGTSGTTTTTADGYGTGAASGGLSAFNTPAVPGASSSAFCPAAIKAVRLFTDGGITGQVNPGDTIEYTVLFRNGTGAAIAGFNITDTLPSGLTYAAGSLVVTASGGAAAAANGAYTGLAGANTLLSAAISLPAGGIIQTTLRATVNTAATAVCGNITNQASGATLGLSDSADNTQNSNGLPAVTFITQSPAFAIAGATDATGVVDVCPPTITKVATLISDPVNGVTNPKRIPGAIVEYTLLVSNPGVAMTANSVLVVDALDASTALVVSDIGGAGSGPLAFTQGAVSSALTYTYTNAASATDDLEYFNNTSGGARITVLTPNANGCDAAIKRIEVNPKGTFADGTAAGTDPSFTLRFRVCIK